MSVARNIIKNPKLVPGGGATELTVSATLKQKSSSVEGIEKVIVNSSVFSFIFLKCGILIMLILGMDNIDYYLYNRKLSLIVRCGLIWTHPHTKWAHTSAKFRESLFFT